MSDTIASYQPQMTQAGLAPTHAVQAMDEYGALREVAIAGERPLTLYLDKREIVTLMTLGSHPEALAIGYLRNQGLISELQQIKSVQVDWDVESVVVTSFDGTAGGSAKLDKRTVTTGCGQGTVFGDVMDQLERIQLPKRNYQQSLIYNLLTNITAYNEVYKAAGAVHGCALCQGTDILEFVEDVGRHNALDKLIGHYVLRGQLPLPSYILLLSGRISFELVQKSIMAGIKIVCGIGAPSDLAIDTAHENGQTLVGFLKKDSFNIYTHPKRIIE